MTTTTIVKMRLPKDGEVSTVAGSFAKAVNDVIGATAAANIFVSTTRAGRYLIATIVLFA